MTMIAITGSQSNRGNLDRLPELLFPFFPLSFFLMTVSSLSLSTLPPSSPSSPSSISSLSSPSSPSAPVLSFVCSAFELLAVAKAAEAFRKAQTYGIAGDRLFLSVDGAGLLMEAFAGQAAFAAWLPAELSPFHGEVKRASFPLLPFVAFLKATKGRGVISFDGKAFAADGGSLALPAEAFELSETDLLYEKELPLLPFLKAEGLSEGFPLAPLFSLKGLPSKDEAKLPLRGFGFSEKSFCATDGYCLREACADLPAYWQAKSFPASAWLPAFVLPLVEACTIKKERESLLGFWQEKREAGFLRFSFGACSFVALRFPLCGSFPNWSQLFPSQKHTLLTDRKALLSALSPLLSALKASAGNPHVQITTDGAIGEIFLSAELMADTGKGSKHSPDLVPMGSQEASVRASFRSFPQKPELSDDFGELKELDREAAKKAYGKESSFLVNGFFLEKLLKSFSGDRVELSWTHSIAPITFSEGKERALLMPVQKRN